MPNVQKVRRLLTCTGGSGNIARPLTLRTKNVNGRSKILSITMSFLPKNIDQFVLTSS